jgi:hypothetical protein
LKSGNRPTQSKQLKQSTARTAPWSEGEMGAKIRYITRASALEAVEGNVLTNMGENIREAIACSRLIEDLERLGREGGNVYFHVIIGLPADLTPAQRGKLLAEITRPIREKGLPFCAALHLPDKRGDQRNYHTHIVVSLRPMARVKAYEWDFAPCKRTWLNTTAGIFLQRKLVVRAFNAALRAGGHAQRWTALSKADRGLQSPGNNKLGPQRSRAARDEAEAEMKLSAARRDADDLKALQDDLGALSRVSNALIELWDGVSRDISTVHEDFVRLAGEAGQRLDRLLQLQDQCLEIAALVQQEERAQAARAAADSRAQPVTAAPGIDVAAPLPKEEPPAPAPAPAPASVILTPSARAVRAVEPVWERESARRIDTDPDPVPVDEPTLVRATESVDPFAEVNRTRDLPNAKAKSLERSTGSTPTEDPVEEVEEGYTYEQQQQWLLLTQGIGI